VVTRRRACSTPKRLGASASLVLAGLSLHGAPAFADEPSSSSATDCARAYEEGQELRKSGQLLSARTSLQSCARDDCPGFIRSDCAAWYGELQSEIPTVVFAARSGGHDVPEVRVSAGDRLLTSRIDGRQIELDPGEYDFQFVAPEMRALEQHFVVARGERNRLIQVELESSATPVPEIEPAPLPPAHRRSLLLPGFFAGLGGLGVVGFATLGAWGRANESKLETTCSPRCSESQVSSVRTKYLLADVSLGVGVASLGLAAYFALAGHGTEAPARAANVAVTPCPGGASVVYGGAF
jgi:hypothetical protein